jgi:hypothetical protein
MNTNCSRCSRSLYSGHRMLGSLLRRSLCDAHKLVLCIQTFRNPPIYMSRH